MNGWYITSDGTKHIIYPTNTVSLIDMCIIELVLPNQVKSVNCSYNNLTKLTIPDSVEEIRCKDNFLTELIIPNKVKSINCSNNKITELIIPNNVSTIECWNNELCYLTLHDKVKTVRCCKNSIREIGVPYGCYIDCDEQVNKIDWLIYNRSKKLKQLLG